MLLSTWISALVGILILGAITTLVKDKEKLWLLVGAGFILGLAVFGSLIVQSREREKTMRVVGYATKAFESDLVKWNVSLSRRTDAASQSQGIRDLAGDTARFKAFLLEKGFTEADILMNPAQINPLNDNYGNLIGYNVAQAFVITSKSLDAVQEIALKPELLSELGITTENSYLAYFYTQLPELKKTLLAEATQDAMARATEISSAAKTRLGKLINARAGVFQITEPYSTEVSDYGIYSTSTRSKHISVTLTAEFQLK